MNVAAAAVLPLERRIERLVLACQPGAREAKVTQLKALAGGNARRAWSFELTWTDGDGLHRSGCVLLARVEPGQLEASVRREFETLAAVTAAGLPAPRPLWLDEGGDLLGMQGFVMTRGEGRSGTAELLKPGSAITRPLVQQLVRLAARLHQLDWRKLHPGVACGRTLPDSPRDELLNWQEQFHRNRMEPLPALASVFGWLHRHLPVGPLVLVHGDFRVGNFLHDGRQVTMLLDWEMAHLGHPLEDIAWAYRAVWSPQPFLPLQECVALYEEASGQRLDPAHLAWWRIFSEVKFAVISLNAARAFADGASSNLRLSARASMVNECLRLSFDWIRQLEAA